MTNFVIYKIKKTIAVEIVAKAHTHILYHFQPIVNKCDGTLMPQAPVAWSSSARMTSEVESLSERSSCRLLVPRTVRRVVEASSCVDWLALVALHTYAIHCKKRGFKKHCCEANVTL